MESRRGKGTRKGMPLPDTNGPLERCRLGGASPCGCPGSQAMLKLVPMGINGVTPLVGVRPHNKNQTGLTTNVREAACQ